MKSRAFALLIVVLVAAAGQVTSVATQPPPRLVADNRTAYFADVYAWNGAGWNFISRLGPRSWQAFPNAANGSLWRAVIGQATRDHRVNYVYDGGYQGYQSVWWIE